MPEPKLSDKRKACDGILELMKTIDPKNTTHWDGKTLSCRLDLAPLIKDPWTMVDLLRNAAKVLKEQKDLVLIPDPDPLEEIKTFKLNPDTMIVPGEKSTGDLLQFIADMME